MEKEQNESNKQKAFQLISEEKVALWAGAGLSLYAGYPSGQDLAEIIWNQLLKRKDKTDRSLAQIADECVKTSSVNELIRKLKSIYQKSPKKNHIHRKIASIPHFNAIITTNYDTLFEYTMGEDLQVIITVNDLAYYDKHKRTLFKIHGDLKHPNSIIITTDDYNKALVYSLGNILYSTVQTKLIEHHILFMGYSLADPNINIMLDNISKVLGRHNKEGFLIDPKISYDKYAELKSRNIIPIEATAEEFINELISHLEDNIVNDFRNRLVSAETFSKFFEHHDLTAQISKSIKGNEIHYLKPNSLEKNVGTFKLGGNKNFKSKMNSFLMEDFNEHLELSENDGLSEFRINNINLLGDQNDKLILVKRPLKNGTASIVFEDGYEHNNIPFEIFSSNGNIWVKALLNEAEYHLKHKKNDGPTVSTSFIRSNGYSTPSNEIQNLEIILRLSTEMKFNIFSDIISLKDIQTKGISPHTDIIKEELELFKNLKKIEHHFGIRFGRINSFNNSDSEKAKKLVQLIEKGYHETELNSVLEMNMLINKKEELEAILSNDLNWIAEYKDWVKVKIFDQEIDLGYEYMELRGVKLLSSNEMILGKEHTIKFQVNNNIGFSRYLKSKI